MASDTDEHFGFAGQPQVDTRTEAYQPNPLAARDAVSLLLPGHNAPRHPTRDLFIDDFPVLGRLHKNVLFIFGGGGFRPGRHKFAGPVIEARDRSGRWRAVDVNVPDCKEDTDALSGTALAWFLLHHNNPAVGRRHNRAGRIRNQPLGIAEKIKCEQAEKKQQAPSRLGNGRASAKQQQTDNHRRQAEVVPLADHSLLFSVTARAAGALWSFYDTWARRAAIPRRVTA